jgi:hypothetical protein
MSEPHVSELPRHLCRYPTAAAIASLAARFNLPNEPNMQDWEHEVSDHKRLAEFLEAYESGSLTEDERFTLMETIVDSVEECPREPFTCHWL